jgi:PAS domain S-box-containing protein
LLSGIRSKALDYKPGYEQNDLISRILKLSPFRIAAYYAVAGGLWIAFSDAVLGMLVHDPEVMTRIAMVKGWVYVAVTAFILYLLILRFERTSLERESGYRALLEQAADGIIITDQDANCLTVNASACAMLGYTEAEFLRLNFRDLILPDDLLATPLRYDEIRSGRTVLVDRRLRRREGTFLPVEISGKMLKDGRILAVIRDLSERKRAAGALEDSERRFRTLAQASFEGIALSEQGVLVDLNDQLADMLGYDRRELIGKPVMDIVAPESRQLAAEAMRSGRMETYEHMALRRNGDIFPVEVRARSAEIGGRKVRVSAVRDVTARMLLEEQLLQSQKMEAVGLLAGGVAHDFNNILTAIIGYGSIVKMKLPAGDPIAQYIDNILASSERAANLTNSLLAFSRKQVIKPRPLYANEIIANVGKLLARLIGEDVELNLELAGRDMTILADAGQIEQVLMNLATNARDAMPSGGTLTIGTERVQLDRDFVARHGFGAPGEYAMITMADTGMGMDDRTRERIFEPFYTTKEVGKGTGLGLSIVYGIIKQHEGHITVDSEPGMGTIFSIYLPMVPTDAEKALASATKTGRGGNETVLVAEDDEPVRDLIVMLLSEAGYTVVSAVDGEDAVRKFMENRDQVQLLVLDVIMPKKNGTEAYEEIRAMKPDIKALYMSGYTADVFEKKNIPEKGLNLITKPVSPTELLKKVRTTLDG